METPYERQTVMALALTDIWIEHQHKRFCVKVQDGKICNNLGLMDERSAHKIHAHMFDAVLSGCLEQVERLKEQQVLQNRPASHGN